jgi:hypothetical protein
MEILEKTTNSRITLRLTNDLLESLKTNARNKDLSLNTLISNMLSKNIAYEETINLIPNVAIPYDLLSVIVHEMDDSVISAVSKDGPIIVKKLFDIMGVTYNIDSIIQNYFTLLSKYCNWFEFSYVQKGKKYRLVFSTRKDAQWIKFIQNYVKIILHSLKIYITSEYVRDDIIVFEFFYKEHP